MVVETFKEAAKTIDYKKCIGKLPDLWIEF